MSINRLLTVVRKNMGTMKGERSIVGTEKIIAGERMIDMRWKRNKEWVLSFLLLSLSFVIRRPHEYGNQLLFATLMEKEGLMGQSQKRGKRGEKCVWLRWDGHLNICSTVCSWAKDSSGKKDSSMEKRTWDCKVNGWSPSTGQEDICREIGTIRIVVPGQVLLKVCIFLCVWGLLCFYC